MATTCALMLTALITPYEVAFVAPSDFRTPDGFFILNRIVDVVFISDM